MMGVVATVVAGCGSDGDPPAEEEGSGSTSSATTEDPTNVTGEAGSTTDPTTTGPDTAPTTTSDSDTNPGETDDSESESETEEPSEGELVPLRVSNFDVPTNETYYGCFDFTFQLDSLGHIVEFRPVIDNAAYVHHFVVTMVDEPSDSPDGYSCFDLEGDMIWAWAPGQGDFVLPEEAGFLIGDNPGGNVTLRLQVHYNNPLGATGETDSSGLDMIVTDQLRPNNAGSLVFGDIEGISIPPGESDYEHIMTCRSEVTADRFEGPLQVFGASMHAHGLGKTLWTEVFRDGEMIMELNRDDPFDFNAQRFNFFEATLMPGDEIVNHCVYDSTDREDTTLGGPGTDNEMCWDTIVYYPKIESGFDYCSSYD